VKIAQGASGNAPPSNFAHQRQHKGNGLYVEEPRTFRLYAKSLGEALQNTLVTQQGETSKGLTPYEPGPILPALEHALDDLRGRFRKSHKAGRRVIFVGNGGSAAIASHMAVDYTKNGNIRAQALNDAPTLTCLANDLGHSKVFASQIGYYATKGDWVVIISSSGRSPNVVEAGRACLKNGIDLVTFTGMDPENRLRTMGALNFWVPSGDYGIVEITHLTLLHAIVSVPTLTVD
jgi:D-sedoheptulose 7-phosphate isomerase